MQFGAHVSSAGGIDTAIDRIEAIGGDCLQLFTQSPRMWRPTNHKPEAIERFKTRRAEAGIGGVVCHALYLCNLAAPDDAIYEKSVTAICATVDTAVAIEADAVIFHVGSHLGAGFDAGLERVTAAMTQILERCAGPTWLVMENSAGAGGTIGRSLDELAQLVDALDRHERLGICLDSCHLYASGYDVTDPVAVGAERHADLLEGEMGEGLGVFLAHPAFQQLGAYLETPGPKNEGPDVTSIEALRALHKRSVAKAKRRAARSR
jgi:deoxyribonuclease-4